MRLWIHNKHFNGCSLHGSVAAREGEDKTQFNVAFLLASGKSKNSIKCCLCIKVHSGFLAVLRSLGPYKRERIVYWQKGGVISKVWHETLLMRIVTTWTGETRLHPGMISRMTGGWGDEQSQVEVRAGFGRDPSIVKLQLQTVPAQVWLYLCISFV